MQFRDNTKPNSDSSDKALVYVLIHAGETVNVYREYIDALDRALQDVTIDPEFTYIDNFDSVIYVSGDKGEMVILVEELL